MSALTISEAAQAAGISRQTLYKVYIKPGKISVNRAEPKKPTIDPSEILRVFGELKPIAQGAALGDEKIAPPDQSATIIAELRAENAGLKTRINDLSDHIQTLKAELAAAKEREIRLLPQPHKGFFSRIFG